MILPNGKPGIIDQWHVLFPSIKCACCMECACKVASRDFQPYLWSKTLRKLTGVCGISLHLVAAVGCYAHSVEGQMGRTTDGIESSKWKKKGTNASERLEKRESSFTTSWRSYEECGRTRSKRPWRAEPEEGLREITGKVSRS